MSRKPLVAGNWKMNLLRADAENFCRRLGAGDIRGVEVVIFPPYPLLDTVARGLGVSTAETAETGATLFDAGADSGEAGSVAAWGAQDLHPADSGAHTGDVSGHHLVDAGCQWVLCGHSERRQDHGESDDLVAQKVAAAGRHGLTPVLCLGETADERRYGKTFEVLDRQLASARAALPEGFVLAYEPIWAIGTGDTASPVQAQEAHAFLRQGLADRFGPVIADTTRILYGGSAKPANAGELFAQPDLDGFLVGGASLDPKPFLAIIGACA
ncbi:MAG: triose-phosphate isomerase [Acidobacteriota bacterium]